jgi:protein gp37
MKNSEINWCDHTFNPGWGCSKVSPACDHCYAEAWDKRYGGDHWGKGAPRRMFGEAHWQEPVKWNRALEGTGRRERVFCASMADVFEVNPAIEKKSAGNLFRGKTWLESPVPRLGSDSDVMRY